MSELRWETWTLPAARLGPENPLPPLANICVPQPESRIDASVSPEDREYFGWGLPSGPLPYCLQDGYNRVRTPRAFPVAVLENEFLRATFFTGFGGRLWSLVHKPTGRELLARNPVFQPCNLAVRNAWFSGGVEWNIGWRGHWPYTCSPLFAACVRLPDGTPALRMWEWERVRQTPFQIDAWLPPGAPVLLVRVAIHNPLPTTTPMYWWSNIAVEQTSATRVIVPAEDALTFESGRLTCTPLPFHNGHDNTYATAIPHSSEWFFRVPGGAQPWIAAVDAQGFGLFQTSTPRLRGRKLFRWGTNPGGQAWQRFLGTPDYIEIQAGLARTQAHHLPMPAGATWTWLEAYGCLQIDAASAHSKEWKTAQQAAAHVIEAQMPAPALDTLLSDAEAWTSIPPNELLAQGSGWGALEATRRERAGEPRLQLPGIFFPGESLGAEQQPWLTLLDAGTLPESPPDASPASYQVQAAWSRLLEQSLAHPDGRHWLSLFLHGVMRWHEHLPAEAQQAWQESIRLRPNLWAEYCLGAAALMDSRPADAVHHLLRAWQMRPDFFPLLAEYLAALTAAQQRQTLLDTVHGLPADLQTNGRIRLFHGQALLELGRLDELARLLEDTFVAEDLREGDSSVSALWFRLQEAREAQRLGRPLTEEECAAVRRANPVPARIDFRMNEG